MKPTQLEFVKRHLLENGSITRNFCLARFISRLGAIVNKLNNEGWNIEGENLKTEHGLDYIYKLVSSPMKKVVYTTEDGRQIVTYQ